MTVLATDNRLAAIREAFPAEGLFAERDWLLSPDPFVIEPKLAAEIQQLGSQLLVFQRACNQLYQLSAKGKQPGWIAEYLDAGKPPELIEFSRRRRFRDDLPAIIRPDLVLTDAGFTIAEIDSVPGGVGLTAWLNQTYSTFDLPVIGGRDGMLDGFQAVLPKGGDILVSQESATYLPEMQWLAAQLNERAGEMLWNVAAAETGEPRAGVDVYRFFELFDLPNLPRASALMEAAGEATIRVTPPFKPYLEEKMWFALFWMQPLREFWRLELGEKYFAKLQEMIPYTWPLDPAPLPQHAIIPQLEIHEWREAARFSQKERDLLVKVSGFSPLSWGSRGVVLGHDLPHAEWESRIDDALRTFRTSPSILQRFHKGRLIEQRYWERETEELKTMRGRVRLCPYYFIESGKAQLRGALATICPADKKLLHGMSDAILAPTAIKTVGGNEPLIR